MEPLLVSHADSAGGAARASYRLHQALLTAEIESQLLVRRRLSEDPFVITAPTRLVSNEIARVRRKLESGLMKLQHSPNQVMHSANALPTLWSRAINRLDPDVVNLHWIGAGAISIADVARIHAPVVMTMHDMWGFCGAEHYSDDSADARWRRGYERGNRPPGAKGVDIDRWTWNRKLKHWGPATVVCPSRWLAECAQQSALMHDWSIHVVPNPLDVDTFRPIAQAEARRALDVPADAALVLFSSISTIYDRRKGFDLLVAALSRISTDRYVIGAVVGQEEPKESPRLPIPIHWLGQVNEDHRLAAAYSAADVVVVPSRQENLAQIGTEAQSCGTPVVAFDTTGQADVVKHKLTGYLAKAFSIDELAEGISWVINDDETRRRLGELARERAVDHWSPREIAGRYMDIYEEAAAQR